jgi:uncharacterized protein
MNKLFLSSVALFVLAATAIAQPAVTPVAQPQPSIFVTGMSEMDIVPDEIYVNVCLREFTKDKKRYSIEELEATFLNFVESTTSTPRADVKMEYTDARIIAMKRRQKDAIIQKVYEVKFKTNDQLMLLFAASDSLNLVNVYVKRYSHSKIEDYKQQVRVNAMKNANEKATYMLAALGQKPGALLRVVEPCPDVLIFDGVNDYKMRLLEEKAVYGKSRASFNGNGDAIMGGGDYYYNSGGGDMNPSVTKTIKLKYYVDVTFAIA